MDKTFLIDGLSLFVCFLCFTLNKDEYSIKIPVLAKIGSKRALKYLGLITCFFFFKEKQDMWLPIRQQIESENNKNDDDLAFNLVLCVS